MINTLTTNLKSTVAATLGATYSELGHVIDLDKNSFKKSAKRYGVRPLSSVEVEGVTKYHTHDQTFEVVLTDWFRDQLVTDSDQRDRGIALHVQHISLYSEIIKQKAGTPANVIIVRDLTIAEPEYIQEENVVAVRATFTIRYRQSLT